jgi:hypothetical protein
MMDLGRQKSAAMLLSLLTRRAVMTTEQRTLGRVGMHLKPTESMAKSWMPGNRY